ncbi:MAG: hypothetical protein ACRD7E_00680 [Bryobacteraceae bacterium]
MNRAPEALQLADEAIVLENAGLHPVRKLLIRNGTVVWQDVVLPGWAEQIKARL